MEVRANTQQHKQFSPRGPAEKHQQPKRECQKREQFTVRMSSTLTRAGFAPTNASLPQKQSYRKHRSGNPEERQYRNAPAGIRHFAMEQPLEYRLRAVGIEFLRQFLTGVIDQPTVGE